MLALAKLDDTDLAKLPVDEIKDMLHRAIEVTSASFAHAARLYQELIDRKEDVTEFQSLKLTRWLPSIAAGTVIPEAVVAFIGVEPILKKLAELPPAEQSRLVRGGTVEVVEKHGDTFDKRMLPLNTLIARPDLVRQVFGERCIRTETAQIAYLTARTPETKVKGKVVYENVTVDVQNGIVKTGKAIAKLEVMREAMKRSGVTI